MPIIQWPKLGFRGGTPGFNPQHFASQANVFSLVGGGTGGAARIVNGPGLSQRPTLAGSPLPTTKLDGRIGPMCYNDGNTGTIAYSGMPTAAFTALTVATIARVDVVTGAAQTAFSDDTASSNVGAGLFLYVASTLVPQLRCGGSTVQVSVAPPALSMGVPYFVAFTGSVNKAGYYVIKNLVTGQRWHGTTAAFQATLAGGGGALHIGNTSSTFAGLDGGVAAAMRSNVELLPQQLLAFADDPWEFWYPSELILTQALATVSTAVTGTFAVTEAPDTAVFAGGVVVSGTLVATEAPDIAVFAAGTPMTGTLAANEAGVALSNSVFTENSVIGTSIGAFSVAGIDSAAFNGVFSASSTLAVTETQDSAAFTGSLPGVITGTLAVNEAGISLSNPVFPENSAVNTDIGTLSVFGIDTGVFVGTNTGIAGTLVATESLDVALFGSTVIPANILGTFALTEAKDTTVFSGALFGPSGQLAATEASDVLAFSGTLVIAAVLAATETRDSAAFNGFLLPLPDITGTLAVTEARDICYFASRIDEEDSPADFANWKFGRRFDRSLTDRFGVRV